MKQPNAYQSRRHENYKKKHCCSLATVLIDFADLVYCGFKSTPYLKFKRNP